MKFKVLASGSKGNCYILSSPTGSLLLDAGIPFREIQKGLDYNLRDITASLVTHEHKDHSKAAEDVMNAGIDCYMSEGTANALGLQGHRLNIMRHKDEVEAGGFVIKAFETQHDAAEPLGFFIWYEQIGEHLLYLTDSYYCKYRFRGLNYIMVESNYVKETLDRNVEAGLIDEALKRRLLESHFSLEHVKDFLQANDLSQCQKIVLLHLSDYNSDAARMKSEIEALTGIETVVAEPGLEVELELYPY